MMNPNRDEFAQNNPLASNHPPKTSEDLTKANFAAGEDWEESPPARRRGPAENLVRENPVPIIAGALILGLAAGWALRYAMREEKETKIKTPLGDFKWSFLTLPLIAPLFKSLREKTGESVEALSDAMRDGARRMRKIDINDYTKPLRKRWRNWTH